MNYNISCNNWCYLNVDGWVFKSMEWVYNSMWKFMCITWVHLSMTFMGFVFLVNGKYKDRVHILDKRKNFIVQ